MAYYDGELLIQNLGKIVNELADTKMPWSEVAIKIGQAIENTPTADVVEVVRCENCTHSKTYPMRIICHRFGRDVNENGFCSYGERKE